MFYVSDSLSTRPIKCLVRCVARRDSPRSLEAQRKMCSMLSCVAFSLLIYRPEKELPLRLVSECFLPSLLLRNSLISVSLTGDAAA